MKIQVCWPAGVQPPKDGVLKSEVVFDDPNDPMKCPRCEKEPIRSGFFHCHRCLKEMDHTDYRQFEQEYADSTCVPTLETCE